MSQRRTHLNTGGNNNNNSKYNNNNTPSHNFQAPSSNPYLDHMSGKKQKFEETRFNFGADARTNPFTGMLYSKKYFDLLKLRKNLPVWEQRDDFIQIMKKNRKLVLVGETGSGKTTQIPQFMTHPEFIQKGQMVACTQPRRIAAVSVAERVAKEMDVTLGAHVGYSVRFEENTTDETCLKYMTDGMLLREAMSDPSLSRYGVIIIDEAHERTLATDILLGLIKELLNKRTDLRLIVMSATLDAGKFQEYLEDCPLLMVPGRVHKVTVFYIPEPEPDYFDAAFKTVSQIHQYEQPGDILLFLTGEEEIEEMVRKLQRELGDSSNTGGIKRQPPPLILPLYSTLIPEQQARVFDPAPRGVRKILISTNIAETSLTIDGIVYVVDPGFAKQKIYNPRVRVESLTVQPISRASAQQRAGRAGRTRPGKCFRLYTESTFKELHPTTFPEILRSNICNVVLTLKKLHVEDLVHFDFLDPPAPETLMRALEELLYLNLIDDSVELTKLGQVVADFPLDPYLGTTLCRSHQFLCSEQILSIVAMLSVPPVMLRPVDKRAQAEEAHSQFTCAESDHITLLNIYTEFVRAEKPHDWCFRNFLSLRHLKSAVSVRMQLGRLMKHKSVPLISLPVSSPNYTESILRALTAGYFMFAAHLHPSSDHYLTIKDNQANQIHPGSGMKFRAPWVIFHEFVFTKRSYIRTISQTRPEWLAELGGEFYKINENFPQGPARTEMEKIWERLNRKSK